MTYRVDSEGRICFKMHDGVEVDIPTAIEVIRNLTMSNTSKLHTIESYQTQNKVLTLQLEEENKFYQDMRGKRDELKVECDNKRVMHTALTVDYQKLSARHNELRSTFQEQNNCLGEHEEKEKQLRETLEILQKNIKRSAERLAGKYEENKTLKQYNADMLGMAYNQAISILNFIKENKLLVRNLSTVNHQYEMRGVEISRQQNLIKKISGTMPTTGSAKKALFNENEILRSSLKVVSEKLLLQAVELNKRESELKEAREISITKQNIINQQANKVEYVKSIIKDKKILIGELANRVRELEETPPNLLAGTHIHKLIGELADKNNAFEHRGNIISDLKRTVTNQATELHSMRKKCRSVKSKDTDRMAEIINHLKKRLESTTDELMKRSAQLSGSRKSVRRFNTVIESLSTSNMELEHKLREMTKSKEEFKGKYYKNLYSDILPPHKHGVAPNCRCISTPLEVSQARFNDEHFHKQSEDEFKYAYDQGELDITIIATIEIDNTKV